MVYQSISLCSCHNDDSGSKRDSNSKFYNLSFYFFPTQGTPGQREKVDWCKSLTDPMMPVTDDDNYYYLSYDQRKPCLYLIAYFEDHRARMCVPNIIEKLRNDFAAGLTNVRYLITKHQPGNARHCFRRHLLSFAESLIKVSSQVRSCRGTAPKTLLDREYQTKVRKDLCKIQKRLLLAAKQLSKHDMGSKLREMNSIVRHMTELMQCVSLLDQCNIEYFC
ncbi:unnamed protein product [Protopolystoma xenopodis]|uniref:Uncharacterized protein n=1 Tax=Protopolystoma xenopodis TaxID=117903 RepID=A0A3S5B4S2_9PLAT|nr:unnamed protein product [Protopolystoma xenopodis]